MKTGDRVVVEYPTFRHGPSMCFTGVIQSIFRDDKGLPYCVVKHHGECQTTVPRGYVSIIMEDSDEAI